MPLPEGPPLEDAIYGSYGPQDVAQGSAPDQGSQAVSGDPGAVTGAPTEEPDQPLPEFDPKYRDPFSGLLYIGALTKEFAWLGHRFVIRTLRTGELTEISLLTKDYVGTDGYLKSWQAATIAAAVLSVDGQPVGAVPLTDEPSDTLLRSKYRYVMDHWFPPVLDKIYQEYIELELTVREVIEAMGNRSG